MIHMQDKDLIIESNILVASRISEESGLSTI